MQKTPQQKIILSLVSAVFLLYAISLVYPFIVAFLSSLKGRIEYFQNPFGLPEEWLFKNYISAFEALEVNGVNFLGMTVNSLILTIGGTVLSLFFTACTSYAMSKFEFRGRSLIYAVAIFVMIIPIVGSLPSQYKIVTLLGLRDSFSILLLSVGGFGFNFLVLYGYFQSVSWSYAEAAYVDGATHYQVFFKVMIQQAMPALVSLGLISAISSWNDYMTPFLYLENLPTLAVGLYLYEQEMTMNSNYPVYYAGVIISMIPVLVMFILFQETIMSNVVAGGLKG